MKFLISKLVWPAYFAALIYLAYLGISQYQQATSILSDHTVVEAPIELVRTSERTKRGHTSTTYYFNYSYEVDDRDYSARYSAVNEKGEAYIKEPFITVAYSNRDPAKVGALQTLQYKSNAWRFVKGFLIFAVILGVVAIFVYGWALPDDEDENEDKAIVPERAGS